MRKAFLALLAALTLAFCVACQPSNDTGQATGTPSSKTKSSATKNTKRPRCVQGKRIVITSPEPFKPSNDGQVHITGLVCLLRGQTLWVFLKTNDGATSLFGELNKGPVASQPFEFSGPSGMASSTLVFAVAGSKLAKTLANAPQPAPYNLSKGPQPVDTRSVNGTNVGSFN